MATLAERFWAKVDRRGPDDCWPWLAYIVPLGYGQFGGSSRAHRVAYELTIGPIPDGMQIDHLCRNRVCVNPVHLEPVTSAENTRRGDAGVARGRQMQAKTHCPHGHAYTAANTKLNTRGHRECRTCLADRRARSV